MKHVVALLVTFAALGALVLPAAADDTATVVRVFELKYRSTADVSAVVQPLLSAQGTVTVQPKRALLTVQDVPEVVERVAAAVATFDHAPPPFKVRVQLLEGHTAPLPAGVQPIHVDARVWRMFNYRGYTELATAEVDGIVGNPASVELGSHFRLAFETEEVPIRQQAALWVTGRPSASARPGASQPTTTAVRSKKRVARMENALRMQRMTLRNVVLWQQRQNPDPKNTQGPHEVLHGNASLGPGQTVVFGVGASERATTALVLVLEALPVVER